MGVKKRMRLARETRFREACEYDRTHEISAFEFGTENQIMEAEPIRATFHRLSGDPLLAGRLIQKKRSASFWLTARKCLAPDGAEKSKIHALAVGAYLRSLTLRILQREPIPADEIMGRVIEDILQRVDDLSL